MPRCCTFLLGWLLLAAAPLCAADYRETKDFADVARCVEAYVDQFGGEHVLFVADIDNTVLAMDQELGSDAWFEWQSYLLAQEPDSPHLVADNFDALLEAQGLLFTLGHMHPPQPEIPSLIRRVQESGVHTLLLTSRGPAFRPQTARELKRNGYDFARTALPTEGVPDDLFFPYDPQAPEQVGLPRAYAQACGLRDPKPISYDDGLLMTSGQHKGAMLRIMLHQADADIDAVVYVDDHGRHVGRIHDALSNLGMPGTVFHYQHEDVRVDRFRYGDKQPVTAAWRRLKRAIDETFPEAVQQQPQEEQKRPLEPATAATGSGG